MLNPPMTIRERLCDMLIDKGFTLRYEDLVGVSGIWRRRDVYRWESKNAKIGVDPGSGLDGRIVQIVSWDTMTNCVKQGFTIVEDEAWWYEVHANERRSNE